MADATWKLYRHEVTGLYRHFHPRVAAADPNLILVRAGIGAPEVEDSPVEDTKSSRPRKTKSAERSASIKEGDSHR